MRYEYMNVGWLVGFGLLVGLIMFGVSFLFVERYVDVEKVSAYECGFDPFEDTRRKFDVRYYLVAILFIIFDLEVIYCIPWAVVLREVKMLGFWSMMVFLGMLLLGYVYEWMKGSLEWE